jgi:hypothetical protein
MVTGECSVQVREESNAVSWKAIGYRNNSKTLGALRGFAAKLEKVGGADLPLDAR